MTFFTIPIFQCMGKSSNLILDDCLPCFMVKDPKGSYQRFNQLRQSRLLHMMTDTVCVLKHQ
jgi:hypothetical protein